MLYQQFIFKQRRKSSFVRWLQTVGYSLLLLIIIVPGVSAAGHGEKIPGRIVADISGTVKDNNGVPLPGVSVMVRGTSRGTTTGNNGGFIINANAGEVLEFSMVGYRTITVTVGNSLNLTVTMETEAAMGSDVVVVGYGTQKKANLTGAVGNITSKELSALQVNTIGEALQGRLPGVYVSIADGKPGRSAGFNIRGNTSINGGGPLIVIDGVPQTDFDLNNLSPYDVQEISVLKDAASTAIYGARASFGVILVTTKRGAKKGINVQYNNYFGYSKATRIPDVYDNPLEYMNVAHEFNANIGATYYTDAQMAYPAQVAQDPTLPHAIVKDIGGKPNLLLGGQVYNYYKIWLREFTPKNNHHLSVSGGDQRFQYFLSGDINHEEGNIKFKPANINRYTLRSNVTYKVSDHISIFNNSSFVKRDENRPNEYLYGFTSNVYRFIENSNPMMPEYVTIDGKEVPTDLGFYKEFLQKNSDINENIHDVRTTLGTDMSFLNNALKVHVDFTYQYTGNEMLRWWDNAGPYLSNSFNNRNIVLAAYSDAGPPKIIRDWSTSKHSNINAYASYSRDLAKHSFTILGGYSQESYRFLSINAQHENPLQVPQRSLNLATGTTIVSDADDQNSNRSMFSRLNYSYHDRYLLEVNGSYFLSSKFDEGKRGHPFLAASAGWRVSEEPFFSGVKNVINELKVRASYGSIGNANIGSYDHLPVMSVSQSSFTLEGSRVNYTSAPAPNSANFTWETVKTADVGVDVAFLRSRLRMNLDLYERNTVNMLANFRALPSVFGATVPRENVAALRNKGWELNVGWNDRVSAGRSDFSYGIGFNVTDYSSVITDYYNPTGFLGNYYVGQNIGEIWGLTTLGYFLTDAEAKSSPLLATNAYRAYAAAGTIRFQDVDKDGKVDFGNRTLDNPGDYKIIGNSTPRYQYGITLNANWHGFDFNSFFRGVGKMDIYPGAEATSFWGAYNRKYQVMSRFSVENRWTPDNPNAYFPRPQGYIALGNSDLGVPQTKYLQNAAFIRLKSLTLGYTVPKAITGRVKMESVRLYLTGQNLWEATKLNSTLDPEGLTKDPDANQGSVGIGTAYPIQRVYAFGLQVQF